MLAGFVLACGYYNSVIQGETRGRKHTNFALTTEVSEVVARHHGAFTMAHQEDLGGVGLCKDAVDKCRQLSGAVLHLVQPCKQRDVLVLAICDCERAVA